MLYIYKKRERNVSNFVGGYNFGLFQYVSFFFSAPDDVPDIHGFLDGKKSAVDNDPESVPFDDVRHYAYEGDGNSTGSLSSLASGT